MIETNFVPDAVVPPKQRNLRELRGMEKLTALFVLAMIGRVTGRVGRQFRMQSKRWLAHSQNGNDHFHFVGHNARVGSPRYERTRV